MTLQELEGLKAEIYRNRKSLEGKEGRRIDRIKWAFEVYLTALARQEAEAKKKRSWWWWTKSFFAGGTISDT